MSFSSQRDVCYVIDLAIQLLIANWVYKNTSSAQAPAIQG